MLSFAEINLFAENVFELSTFVRRKFGQQGALDVSEVVSGWKAKMAFELAA